MKLIYYTLFIVVITINNVICEEDDCATIAAHDCMTKHNVSPELVDRLNKGDFMEDPKIKQYVFCILEKCKIITKDGKVKKIIADRSNKKFAQKVVRDCMKKAQGNTPTERAWNMFKCTYYNQKKFET